MGEETTIRPVMTARSSVGGGGVTGPKGPAGRRASHSTPTFPEGITSWRATLEPESGEKLHKITPWAPQARNQRRDIPQGPRRLTLQELCISHRLARDSTRSSGGPGATALACGTPDGRGEGAPLGKRKTLQTLKCGIFQLQAMCAPAHKPPCKQSFGDAF